MRIRKRAVPLPLSLLSPVPLPPSDPRLVQLPTNFQPSDHLHLLPPDQPPSSGDDRRPATAPPTPQLRAYEHEMNKDQREEISNPSKQSDSGTVADPNHGLHPLPSTPSSHEKVALVDGSADGRWCDGDKAIPLKKRKASFEMNGMVVSEGESKMKSKTNKKCLDRDDDYSVDDFDDPISTDDNGHNKSKKTTKKKKRKTTKKGNNGSSGGAKKKAAAGKKSKNKGGSIMEGSSCSRVNGRGWRCMQPTLVGYSLCEHHLGKGRLRSMSSVRALPKPKSKPDEKAACNGKLGHYGETTGNGIQEDCDDEKKPNSGGAGSKTKRRRIGMVKARSLSSLLCQPNTSVVQLGSTTTTTFTTTAIKQA